MNILIIYATRNGSVEAVAKLLKKKLNGKVTLINSAKEEVSDICKYETVLLGSSIYFGQLQKGIKRFVSMNRPELLRKNIGIFLMAGEQNLDKLESQIINAISPDMYDKSVITSVFGSELKFEKFPLLVRFLLKRKSGRKSNYTDIDKNRIDEFATIINDLDG